MADTCGAFAEHDCCGSTVIPGGTYNIINNPAYPATIHPFRMDTYEVTLGRFRKFVSEYPSSMPAAGSGKNPNNPSDPGWNSAAWSSLLPASQASMVSQLESCVPSVWTDVVGSSADESKPINCVTWYIAEAFCIWDGGRLATQAEWGFAASGGNQQRVYPWSLPPSSSAITSSFARFDSSAGTDNNCAADGVVGCALTDIVVAGSLSAGGQGRWGQADLAGNLWEWTQDYFQPPAVPCNDCASLTSTTSPDTDSRVLAGGSYFNHAWALRNDYRLAYSPTGDAFANGIRCVRSP